MMGNGLRLINRQAGVDMREFSNRAHVQGLYRGKRIHSVSNSWKITVRRKYRCACERICEAFPVTEARSAECCVYYHGVQQLEWNRVAVIAVGYEICVRYRGRDHREKIITKRGNALFFHLVKECRYLLRIPNPPRCRVLKDKIVAEFPVVIAFE